MNNPTLTPAYGRDYNSQKAVKEDFFDGKDFILNDISSPYDGKVCNHFELKNAGVKSVVLRYGKLRKVLSVTI